MAKQKGNIVTRGLSGKIGDLLIFSRLHGRTFVSSTPRTSSKVTENRQTHRRRFQHAVLYGNAVAADPGLNAAYAAKAKPGQSVRNVAVTDFFHASDIETVDVSSYHGQPGDVIRIIVTDDFAVKEVKVVIVRFDGRPVKEGFAVQEAVGYEWTYTATQVNNAPEGDRIEIYASDLPDNITTETPEI